MHMVTLSSLVVLFTFLMTWKKIPLLFSLLASLLSAAYYWSWPHPFYDFTSHFWGLTATALLFWQLPFQSRKSAFYTAFLAGFFAVLSVFTKTNTGGAYGLFFGTVLLLSPLRIPALGGYIAGVLFCLFFSFVTFLPHPWAYYENAFMSYGYWRTNQLYRFIVPMVWFKNFYWLPFLVLLFFSFLIRFKSRGKFFLFLGLGVVGLFTLNTGSRREWDHLPVMGMYLGMAYVLLFMTKERLKNRFHYFLFWACLLTVTWVNGIQIKRCFEGGLRHYELTSRLYPHGRYQLKTKPLEGWQFIHPEGAAIDYLADYIKKNVPPSDSLLILSNLQILNALTGREGYPEVPYIWEPEGFPLQGTPVIEKAREHILKNPPDWIVFTLGGPWYESLQLHNLLKYMDLLELEEQYKIAGGLENHGILKKR